VGSFPGSDIIWKNYREPPEEGAISQASTTLSCGPILLHVLPCEIHSTKHEAVEVVHPYTLALHFLLKKAV
jgi:hypothetical protein